MLQAAMYSDMIMCTSEATFSIYSTIGRKDLADISYRIPFIDSYYRFIGSYRSGKTGKVREFVRSGKVKQRSGKNIIFEKSENDPGSCRLQT